MNIEYLGILGSYLIGSVPFGLLVAKLSGGLDPREHGSRNIGFTNVLRVSGKTAGILTLLGDMGKGFFVTGAGKYFDLSWNLILLMGGAVIVGHVFSLFLGLKGGKGVATALGAIVGLHGGIGLGLIGIWLLSVFTFRYSSGGALTAFTMFPLLVWLSGGDKAFLGFSVAIMLLIFFCHKGNIVRLYHGAEPKIRLKST
ncbi:MAG: glycerol-3-phosphate 1-O-acyltransferase PlsY [Nitrospirales bacterium]|nr:glycerol-3-phosphate 1-O-acyltransferase PlsY [Nitrospirales bacterium]